MERCEALRTLYQHIQFKDRLRTGTAVVSYAQEANRVSVQASDGLTYHGDILIGADGIHSRVRQIMSEEVRTQNPKLSQEIDEGEGPISGTLEAFRWVPMLIPSNFGAQ